MTTTTKTTIQPTKPDLPNIRNPSPGVFCGYVLDAAYVVAVELSLEWMCASTTSTSSSSLPLLVCFSALGHVATNYTLLNLGS